MCKTAWLLVYLLLCRKNCNLCRFGSAYHCNKNPSRYTASFQCKWRNKTAWLQAYLLLCRKNCSRCRFGFAGRQNTRSSRYTASFQCKKKTLCRNHKAGLILLLWFFQQILYHVLTPMEIKFHKRISPEIQSHRQSFHLNKQ